MQASFPSKLLLFGEYTVLLGRGALAVPYGAFGGHLSFDAERPSPFGAWFAHLSQMDIFDAHQLNATLAKGICFHSNIPQGYGLGSSGALCAAIYAAFAKTKTQDAPTLQAIFAQMEGFFHGASSGADPLISYLGRPMLLRGKEQVANVQLPDWDDVGQAAFFLLDTCQARQTAPLVKWFKQQRERAPNFADALGALNDEAIAAFLQANHHALFQLMDNISAWQWDAMRPLIPHNVQTAWQLGLASDCFRLKLCGAGGGGFLLGFTNDWPAAAALLHGFTIRAIEWAVLRE
jgi:mevalonate kinase